METTSAAPQVRHLDSAAVRERAAAWTGLYNACFSAAPWNEPHHSEAEYLELISWHLDQPGLRGVEVCDADGAPIAVAYGWPCAEQVPDSGLYRRIAEALGPEATAELWAERPFEIVEVMVGPAARGLGLGRSLLTAIRAGFDTAWLLTRADSDAPAFYRALGWERAAEVTADGYDLYVLRANPA